MNKQIERKELNHKHKIVYLFDKGEHVKALEYCFNKGKLLDKYIMTSTIFSDLKSEVLRLEFYINGYFSYFEISLNTKNGLNPNAALYWDNNMVITQLKHNHWNNGISIRYDF